MPYTEPKVYVPLNAGVVPFPLTRVDSNPDFIFVHRIRPYMHDEDEEDEETPRAKSKLAECLSRFKLPTFRRAIKEVPSSEFVWQTAESNWRPGLVTLEQAARRKEIVHRAEAFEKL